MQINTPGPWIITQEGCAIIKRAIFDDSGSEDGYELLDGNYAALAGLLEALEDSYKAMATVSARDNRGARDVSAAMYKARIAINRAKTGAPC